MPENLPRSTDARGDGTLSTGELGTLLLLQLITEQRMAAGVDEDGSATLSAALAILGGWEQIGRVANAAGTPFTAAAAAPIGQLRAALTRAEPILARIARPRLTPRS